MRIDFLDRVEGRVNRAVTGGFGRADFTIDIQFQFRSLRTFGATGHGQANEFDMFIVAHAVIDQGDDIVVIDFFFLVSQILEAGKGIFDGVVAQIGKAQLLELFTEGMATGMLAHDQA